MSFFKKLKKNIGVPEQETKPEIVLASAGKIKKIKVEKTPSLAKPVKEEKKTKSRKSDSEDWIMPSGQLSVDVYETDKEFCVRSPIAGLEPDEIDVSAEDNMLIIKGERKEEEKEEGKNYYYQE